MKTIKQLLDYKGYAVFSIAPTATVYEAIEKMADKEVGALVVMRGEKMVGIISERDYARKVILKGHSSKETKVSEIMTSHVIYTSPDETIENCMALMTARRIRHLPVVSEGQVIGVISLGDLVRAIMMNQENTIRKLENYIKNYTSIT